MKLLVLGASGATGGWLTRMSVQASHEVTAVVRQGAKLVPPPNVRVIRGEVLDAATLATAMEGQDAVACCLGIRRAGKPLALIRSKCPNRTTALARHPMTATRDRAQSTWVRRSRLPAPTAAPRLVRSP